MNCFVDFSEELSRLKLSEHPNSLFEFRGEVMPSEFDSGEISNSALSEKPCRQNRSSSSGFLKKYPASATVCHSLTVDGMKCEFSDQEPSCNRHSSATAMNQLHDTVTSNAILQQTSAETSSPSVKSWAAVLAAGKNTRQPVSSSVARGRQSDQTKPLNNLSAKNTPVNQAAELKSAMQSQVKSKSRSATRGSDQMQFSSSDGVRNRTKSNERMSTKNHENQSVSWVTVSSHDRKNKSSSRTRQPHNDASVHSAGSYTDVKTKQHKRDGESTGTVAATDAADAPNSQSKAAKQKKKKKKSKATDVASEEMSNPVERIEISQPALEFNNLNEFPSLFSLKSDSKKTPLQSSSSSSTVNMPYFTSGIL